MNKVIYGKKFSTRLYCPCLSQGYKSFHHRITGRTAIITESQLIVAQTVPWEENDKKDAQIPFEEARWGITL